MPFHQLDVPALPILLPLGGVLMVGSWLLLHRRGLLSARRLTTAWLAGWYAVAVIGATLLPLHLAWGPAPARPTSTGSFSSRWSPCGWTTSCSTW
jgi:hypothetical protein